MTKPSTITQWLTQPSKISPKQNKEVKELLKTYPYLMPARFLEAAEHHRRQPFAPAMMNSSLLYMGNWILFHEFIEAAKSGQMVAAAPIVEEEEIAEEEELVPQTTEETIEDGFEDDELGPDDDLEPFDVEEEIDGEFDTDDEEMVEEEEDKLEYDYNATVEETIAKALQEPVPAKEIESREKEVELDAEKAAPKKETAKPAEAGKVKEGKNVNVAEPKGEPVADGKNEEGLIQPLYTEDYFLHQGIPVSEKIPDEVESPAAKAKSLMVVMSFSEWLIHFKTKGEREKEEQEDQKALKTMWQKEKLAAALEEENEEIPENVFEMAVNSIAKEEDLASESLAEILIKQGKYGKAIDMYRKLSLRNPQKNAYFARKIEALQKEKES